MKTLKSGTFYLINTVYSLNPSIFQLFQAKITASDNVILIDVGFLYLKNIMDCPKCPLMHKPEVSIE